MRLCKEAVRSPIIMSPPSSNSIISALSDQEAPLLESSPFVHDGTVDFRAGPALRAKTGGWFACFFIIGYELIERLAYYGITANLVLYMRNELHMGTASASENVNNWTGATTVLPIFGAFLADAYLGRFWTITWLSLFYVLGMIMLTLSASLKALKPPSCTGDLSCPDATSAQLAFYFISLYLVAIGTAGVKPCLEAFGADQFDDEDEIEMKSKSSFFNWWYFGLATGSLLGFSVMVYVEDNASYGLAYGIMALLITAASCLFLVGIPLYRNRIPGGSPLTRIVQVLIAASRKWGVKVPHDESLLFEAQNEESVKIGRKRLLHTSGLRCLDKAATVCPKELEEHGDEQVHGSFIYTTMINPWKLCTVTQVEEVKLIVRVVPVWLNAIVYGLVVAQGATFFVQQASTMDRKVGSLFEIPSGSLLSFSSIAVLVVLPIYDQLFVPLARSFTGHKRGLTLLQRFGTGIFLAIICMVIAALVERKRLQVAEDFGLLDDPGTTIPMSVFWLTPQFLFLGLSDVFALVGEQEFFYDQVPDTMRSLGMSLYLCANGLSSYLSSAIISIVDAITSRGGHQSWFVSNLNRCHLDYYYWLLVVLSILNLAAFGGVSWWYTYKAVAKTS